MKKKQSLVEYNCDVTIVNKNGHTACFVAEFYGNHECVHYLMIVETCINLSIKLVRTGKRLRESKASNEILKAQMDEAISINNDFINQRENIMNISLDLMRRQIDELEAKLLKEIERVQTENRSLFQTIQTLKTTCASSAAEEINYRYLNLSPIPSCPDSHQQPANRLNLLESELAAAKQELGNTELNCYKILKIDQNRLDNVKTRFDEIKQNAEHGGDSNLNSNVVFDFNKKKELGESKEHLDILRKMYQETTHKLMIFRNALKERQVIKTVYHRNLSLAPQSQQQTNSNITNASRETFLDRGRNKTPTNEDAAVTSAVSAHNSPNYFMQRHHNQQISPSSSSSSNTTPANGSPNHSNNIQNKINPASNVILRDSTTSVVGSGCGNKLNSLSLSNQINNFNLNELDLIVEEVNI